MTNHPAIQSDQMSLLDVMAKNIRFYVPDVNWHSMQVDLLVSPQKSICCKASYFLASDPDRHNFRLGFDEEETLEKTILLLYDHGLNSKDAAWNKARYTSFRSAGSARNTQKFEYHFDPDYQWLEMLEMDSFEYEILRIQDELDILSWEGLALNHPRLWRNRPCFGGVQNG